MNIAPNARGYTWFNITSSYSGNQRTEPGINDSNLTQNFALSGGGDDNPVSNEAAGVVWSTTQTVKSVKYYSGSCDAYQNGPFTGNVAIQFTTDGIHWVTDPTWTISPAYPLDSCGATPSAAGQIFTFSGPARSGVLGVRIIGTVRTTTNSQSWHAIAREVQVFN